MSIKKDSSKFLTLCLASALTVSANAIFAQTNANESPDAYARLSASAGIPAGLVNDNPFKAVIIQADSLNMKFRVQVLNPEAKRVAIFIRSKSLGILFSRTFSDQEYAYQYDLSQLEDGQYSIEVLSGKEIIKKDIHIETITQIQRKALVN